jgi:hypothetical protein
MRKIYKTSLCIIVMIALNNKDTKAQLKVNEYKLSDFKYRTNGYRALGLFGDFSSGINNSLERDTFKNNNSRGWLNAEARYMLSKSTEQKQKLNIIYTLIIPYNGGRTNRNNTKTVTSASDFSLGWQDFNRVFKKDFFYEYGTTADLYATTIAEKTNNVKSRTNVLNYMADATIGAGKGRLEQVTDAQTALFILQDLFNKGSISSVSPEMTDAFARFITSLRNKRVFDLRRRTKFHIKQIDSFLVANKIIKATDADFICIINDNLFFSFNNDFSPLPRALHFGFEGDRNYGNGLLMDNIGRFSDYIAFRQLTSYNQGGDFYIYDDYISEFNVQLLQPMNEQTLRLSGKKMYVRARGVYSGGQAKNRTAPETTRGIIGQIGLEKQRPVNLHWQENYGVSISGMLAQKTEIFVLNYFQQNLTTGAITSYSNSNFVWLNARYAKGYYPNGRTSIEAVTKINMAYGNSIPDGQSSLKNNAFVAGVMADLNATYFLNANTVVKGYASLYYTTNIDKISGLTQKGRSAGANFSIGIIHNFF